jgi:hypothetical protein
LSKITIEAIKQQPPFILVPVFSFCSGKTASFVFCTPQSVDTEPLRMKTAIWRDLFRIPESWLVDYVDNIVNEIEVFMAAII